MVALRGMAFGLSVCHDLSRLGRSPAGSDCVLVGLETCAGVSAWSTRSMSRSRLLFRCGCPPKYPSFSVLWYKAVAGVWYTEGTEGDWSPSIPWLGNCVSGGTIVGTSTSPLLSVRTLGLVSASRGSLLASEIAIEAISAPLYVRLAVNPGRPSEAS
jgi:hypothetical protein